MPDDHESIEITCPTPAPTSKHVLLGHGSGGRLSAELLHGIFLARFSNPVLQDLEDQATSEILELAQPGNRLAFTTDSYVVRPIFFPGGDIGHLAVNGTINDLAVGGAHPKQLSAGFILEEGLLLEDLCRVVDSMKSACDAAGIALVTGDTKVVDKGRGDNIFITTAGIGVVPAERKLSIHNAQPGDQILVSGTLGDHGIAIMSVRAGLDFETTLESDTAPLNGLTEMILSTCPATRCMRDITRGGLASVLHELAAASNVGIEIDELSLPIKPEVSAACELLGLDVMHVANEGKLIAVVPQEHADDLLVSMRQHPLASNAAIIGRVTQEHPKTVLARTPIGGLRMITMLSGEQLPRIC